MIVRLAIVLTFIGSYVGLFLLLDPPGNYWWEDNFWRALIGAVILGTFGWAVVCFLIGAIVWVIWGDQKD